MSSSLPGVTGPLLILFGFVILLLTIPATASIIGIALNPELIIVGLSSISLGIAQMTARRDD